MSGVVPPPPPATAPGPPPSGPPPGWTPASRRGGLRTAAVVGGSAVGVAAIAGATAAAFWYFGSGPQPAEALPADTVAYLSVDLDPSGEQLLEARRMLEQFPAWKELGIESRGDLREQVFDLGADDLCADLDYGDDIEPWLGDRMALAIVPADDGSDAPVDPVFVVQVSDPDAAADGLAAIADCMGPEAAGWHVGEEWAVVAETEQIADRVAADAAEEPLSDNDEFEDGTDDVGGPGIVNAYISPAAGDHLADLLAMAGEGDDLPPPETLDMIAENFGGVSISLRFDDGTLELASAGRNPAVTAPIAEGDHAAEVVESLPEDTAAAYGIGFEPGWFDSVLEVIKQYGGPDTAAIDADLAAAEEELGMDLAEAVETLLGEAAVLAVGGDVDIEQFESASPPPDLPLALKVKGEPEEIEDVLDRLRELAGAEEEDVLDSDVEGEVVVVGPSGDYRDQLLDDGGLGLSEKFRRVVPDADKAGVIFYADLEAGWISDLVAAEAPPEVAENVEPLNAFGMTGWIDADGVTHSVVRLSVD